MKQVPLSLLGALPLALSLGSPAMAGDLPRYNVERHCNAVAQFGGGSSMIYNGCIDMEQEAYDNLNLRWGRYTTRQKSYCGEVATFGGPSYSVLESCLQMETEATGSTRSFRY